MRVSFEVLDGHWISDEESMGFTCEGTDKEGAIHYLNLQGPPEEPSEDYDEDDLHIHLEFDNQGNSGYECVRRCRLTRRLLSIDLSKPLGQWIPEVEGFDIGLSKIDDAAYDELRTGLPRAFRGSKAQLEIE